VRDPAFADARLRRASPAFAAARLRWASRAPTLAIAALLLVVLAAPFLAPYDPGRLFANSPFAPPMRPHIVDDQGAWHLPFAYRVRLVDPIERRYEEDRTRRVTFGSGEDGAWFLLGTDALGRDVLSRVLVGARLSLGVALLSTLLALGIGAAVGAAAGHAGGLVDATLMRIADLVIVLPGIYVVLALRGVLPIFLTNTQVFVALVGVLAFVGWPSVARGVRGIVLVEGRSEYAEAARALGAGSGRVIARHLLPATRGFLAVQATVLVPAFIMAEATLSYVSLGFATPTPSWGVMLLDAAAVRVVADAPWLLAPAAAIVATVLLVNCASASRDPLLWVADPSKSIRYK
jgi:peptide/nickel transport system permease protein